MKCYYCDGTGNLSNPTIGDRLKLAIDMSGKSQIELARLSGLSRATVSNILSGSRRPNIDTATRICKVLNITIDWLATGKEN